MPDRAQLLHWLRRYGAWLLGFTLLAMLLLRMLTPDAPSVTLMEPQTVDAVHDHVCVHTRLIDEVAEDVIQQSLIATREMGASTIVEFFPWAYIEQAPGEYDWEQADTIMRHAENQGLRVIARMGYVPVWARPADKRDSTTLNYIDEDAYDDFAHFVGVFAERYAGIADHLVIWNEPNLAFEWGYRPVDPAGYAELLHRTYPVAKAANPDVQILAGALAPTLEPEGSSRGLNEMLYLQAMYEAGAADYFDALAVHTYGFTHPPTMPPAAGIMNFRRAEELFTLMERYDDSDKPVYITESGWNGHPRWTQAVRPSQRVGYTIEAFEFVAANWSQVETLCIWALRYPLPTFSYPDGYTLITVDFQYKPIYHAIRAYARGAERSDDLWLPPPAER